MDALSKDRSRKCYCLNLLCRVTYIQVVDMFVTECSGKRGPLNTGWEMHMNSIVVILLKCEGQNCDI